MSIKRGLTLSGTVLDQLNLDINMLKDTCIKRISRSCVLPCIKVMVVYPTSGTCMENHLFSLNREMKNIMILSILVDINFVFFMSCHVHV